MRVFPARISEIMSPDLTLRSRNGCKSLQARAFNLRAVCDALSAEFRIALAIFFDHDDGIHS